MKDQPVQSNTIVARTHHWIFEKFLRTSLGIPLLIDLVFSQSQVQVIDSHKSLLLSTRTTSPRGSLQDADALIAVPLRENARGDNKSIQILVELKSKLRRKQLMSQLLRYYFGTVCEC